MHPPTRTRMILALALLFAPLSTHATEATPAATETATAPIPPLSLEYHLYASGLDVVTTTVNLGLTDKSYVINATTNTRGIWKTLVPWSNVITARGGNTPDGTISPELARYDTIWKEKLKIVEMTFDKEHGILAKWTPERHFDERIAPTPEQLRTAMDPLSAVAAVLAKGEARGCEGKIPAFDGRRLYNLVLHNNGKEVLEKNRYSIFAGEATRCEITFEPVAGFPKKEKRRGFWNATDNTKDRNPLIIWLADNVQPDLPTLPVRVQTTTQLGTLIAHMTAIHDNTPATPAP